MCGRNLTPTLTIALNITHTLTLVCACVCARCGGRTVKSIKSLLLGARASRRDCRRRNPEVGGDAGARMADRRYDRAGKNDAVVAADDVVRTKGRHPRADGSDPAGHVAIERGELR